MSPERLFGKIAGFAKDPFGYLSVRRQVRKIRRCALFDESFYLSHNPDLSDCGDPAQHFAARGWREGRDPGPEFSTRYYLGRYPDVASEGVNPLIHYIRTGRKEGRYCNEYAEQYECVGNSALFSRNYYLASNPDVAAAGADPLQHFLNYGWREGRDPGPEFSTRYYLERYPDVASEGVNPLVHYLRFGKREGRHCSEYAEKLRDIREIIPFSREHYLAAYPDVAAAGADPLRHFLEHGWMEGRSPSPGFNLKRHIRENPEIEERLDSVLPGFKEKKYGVVIPHRVSGERQAEKPKPESAADPSALNVTFTRGLEIIRASGLFDESYYLDKNRDVKEAGVDALDHFCRQGWREYRNPSAQFNIYSYLCNYPEVAASGVNPLLYYLQKGRHESHDPYKGFKTRPVTEEDAALLRKRLEGCSTLFSVVMPTYNRAGVICNAVDSVLRQSYPHFELIVSDDGSGDGTAGMLAQRYASEIERGKIRIIENAHAGVSAARNAGLRQARGEWIAYLDSDNAWHPHYLLFVADAFAAAPDRKNCYAHIEVKDRIGDRNYLRNPEFSLADMRSRNFIDLNIYAHHRSLYETFGGFDEAMTRLVDWDVIARHTACYRPIPIRYVLADYNLDNRLDNITACVDYRPNRKRLMAKIDEYRNRLVAIKVPAPDLAQAREWGDYHLALALQRELIRLGYMARIDTRDDWYNPECKEDRIVIFVRGIGKYEPDPSAINILWHISHPDKVKRAELAKYDLILVASRQHAEHLSAPDLPPVEVMEQFADPEQFFPDQESAEGGIDLLFVGNSRNVYRRIVKDCIGLGCDIAVYGSMWEKIIDARYIKGRHIGNHELRRYYAGAKIVLNDHWDDMAARGFVSNRIYDVGASGGFVLSDHNPAIAPLFGDAVVTYEDREDLGRKIDYYLARPDERSKKARQLHGIVMESHTAAIRAGFLHERMQALLDMRACLELSEMKRLQEPAIPIDGSEGPKPDGFRPPLYETPLEEKPAASDARLIAWYLPQFYPFRENDEFWGPGFTDWHNVKKGIPVYRGHYQPKVPGELGFYDNRDPENLARQAGLARRFGLYGFCFHYYHFNGRPVMDVPIRNLLSHGEIDIRFCLHWANEPWTRTWDGSDRDRNQVLLAQDHNFEDDMRFFQDILPALRDERYIRIGGRPLLLIYRPHLFRDIRRTADAWRGLARRSGVGELYLGVLQTSFSGPVDPGEFGFEAAVEFPPHCVPRSRDNDTVELHDRDFRGLISDYYKAMRHALLKPAPRYRLFRGVMTGFDNAARKNDPLIYANASPTLYKYWLMKAIENARAAPGENERFVFINAWNEWAEGAYLEPDQYYGYAYLNATLEAANAAAPKQRSTLPAPSRLRQTAAQAPESRLKA